MDQRTRCLRRRAASPRWPLLLLPGLWRPPEVAEEQHEPEEGEAERVLEAGESEQSEKAQPPEAAQPIEARLWRCAHARIVPPAGNGPQSRMSSDPQGTNPNHWAPLWHWALPDDAIVLWNDSNVTQAWEWGRRPRPRRRVLVHRSMAGPLGHRSHRPHRPRPARTDSTLRHRTSR